CPVAAEQPVRIREMRRSQGRALRAYWTEDTEPRWYQLFETFWLAPNKEDLGWPDEPYQVLDGSVQRFAGGVLFRLPRADGAASIVQLVGDGESGPWREIVAPPIAPAGSATL